MTTETVAPVVTDAPAAEAVATDVPSNDLKVDIEALSDQLGAELLGEEVVETDEPAPVAPKKDEKPPITAAAPKPGEKTPPVVPAAASKDEKPAAAAPATPPDPKEVYKDLPEELKTWRPEAAAAFKSLPEVVRNEIVKREQDIRKGLEQYKGESDFARAFKQTLAPFMPNMQRYGVDPLKNVQSTLQIQHVLAFGAPAQKVQMLRQLADQFKIPMDQVTSATPPVVDPNVEELTRRQAAVESHLSANAQAALEAQNAANEKAVEEFAKSPDHPYFEEVSEIIADVLTKKIVKTLPEAYAMACQLSPSVQAKERQKAIDVALEASRKTSAEAASKAASLSATSIKAASRPNGSAPTPVGSLDDTLNETMRAINARG